MVFCAECGAQAADTQKFCVMCGTAFAADRQQPALSPPPPLPPIVPAATPALAGRDTDSPSDLYAGFWPRALAFVIDYVIIVFACGFLRGLVGIKIGGGDSIQGFFWLTLLALLVYKAGMESSARQATLGKLALDIKVTSLSGERIDFGRALWRNFSQIFSAITLYIGYLMPTYTKRRQALHDMIAGTLVTRRQYAPAEIVAAAASVETQARAARAQAGTEQRQAATARRRVSNAQQQLPNPQAELGAESRPELPLRLSFRDAWLGSGKRAVLENLSDSTLEVVLDVQNPRTGAHFRRAYVINPLALGEIRQTQGRPFASGQLVTVSNPRYRPIVQTVS